MRALRSGSSPSIKSFSVLPVAASLPEHNSSSCRRVTGKPAVGRPDQVTIEPILIGATVVAGRQKDRVARVVKMRQMPPTALTRSSFILEIGGPVQRISMRPIEVRPLLLQCNHFGKDFVLHPVIERLKIAIEILVEFNGQQRV